MRICIGRLLRCQLQACDVINKQNLDVILHSDLGYMDLSRLHTSLDYLSRLRKDVFAMVQQLSPSTFFITFTSVESKWLPLLKCLYDLNSKIIKLNIPFVNLELEHVVDITRCDLATCA